MNIFILYLPLNPLKLLKMKINPLIKINRKILIYITIYGNINKNKDKNRWSGDKNRSCTYREFG